MKKILSIALFLSQLITPASAESTSASGFYASVEYGTAKDGGEAVPNSQVSVESSSSLGVYIGYKTMGNWYWEFGRKQIGEQRQIGTVTQNGTTSTVDLTIDPDLYSFGFRYQFFNYLSFGYKLIYVDGTYKYSGTYQGSGFSGSFSTGSEQSIGEMGAQLNVGLILPLGRYSLYADYNRYTFNLIFGQKTVQTELVGGLRVLF